MEGRPQGVEESGATRAVTYCLLPAELAPKLHDLLREHFGDVPDVEVIVERRCGERRGGEDRRAEAAGEPPAGERREIVSAAGRRIGERRASQVPVEPPALPRRARRYADRLSFVERLEPAGDELEDRDTARLVVRLQAGDDEAFATLYARYFDRVYGYLRLVMKNREDAEDATQQVFTNAFEALPRYQRRRQPFRGWLFTIARNYAVSEFRKQHEVALAPEELDRRREQAGAGEADAPMLDWISNQDFLILIERLPARQRQILVMRFMLDMTPTEIGPQLGIEPNNVRALQHRGLGALERRLTALGRAPRRDPKARMRRWPKRAPVLRERRFALLK